MRVDVQQWVSPVRVTPSPGTAASVSASGPTFLEQQIERRKAEIASTKKTLTRDDFSGEVECAHCGGFMELDTVMAGVFQCTCPQCGCSGPRARSEYKALSFASLLFK